MNVEKSSLTEKHLQMNEIDIDILIIGAGPAGLKAAEVLARNGKEVLILEKNPGIVRKVCAGGLTPKAFEAGIPVSLADRRFFSLRIHISGKTIEEKNGELLVATIDRKKLGQWMLKEALKEGAKVKFNAEVVRIENRAVVTKQGRKIKFNCLIGADGSSSMVRKYLKLPNGKQSIAMQYLIPCYRENIEVFFDESLFGKGLGWVFPHKDFTSFGCGDDLRSQSPRQLREHLDQWLREEEIEVNGAEFQAALLNYDYNGFQFKNIFLAGDAAGLVFDLTGEGIYSALISGQEIAKKILNPDYNCPKMRRLLRMKKVQGLAKFFPLKILKMPLIARIATKQFVL